MQFFIYSVKKIPFSQILSSNICITSIYLSIFSLHISIYYHYIIKKYIHNILLYILEAK